MSVPTHSAYERRIKRHLRKQRRVADRAGTVEEVEKLDEILESADKFQILCEQIVADSKVPTDDLVVNWYGNDGDYGVVSGLLALFAWMLANWSNIMEMIDAIISRFTSEMTASGSDGECITTD